MEKHNFLEFDSAELLFRDYDLDDIEEVYKNESSMETETLVFTPD